MKGGNYYCSAAVKNNKKMVDGAVLPCLLWPCFACFGLVDGIEKLMLMAGGTI